MSAVAHRPTLSLLSPGEPERIVGEACRVLETVGVLVENEEGRGLLAKAGAGAANGRHHLPERLVREALATAPRRIVLYDVNGEPACDLGEDRVHFDPGSAAIHVLDPETRRRREATTRDVTRLARLVDRL